jgi:hypothetical protein
MRSEDAFDFLVRHLSEIDIRTDGRGNRLGTHSSDVWIPDVAWSYWVNQVDRQQVHDVSHLAEEQRIPFYDAAWELCRIGVLRPGTFAPTCTQIPAAFGDQY